VSAPLRRPSRASAAYRSRAVACALAVVLAAAGVAASPGPAQPRAQSADAFQVLVYSRTEGFRHLSIPSGIRAIRELGAEHGFGVEATEDPAQFTRRNLKRFEAVVFLLTTGTVLEEPQKRAFMRYVRRGGGYVGVHSAADTEYDWPFYGRLVGAYFKSHPIQQFADFLTEAPRHPATAHLPPRFNVFDEHYSFKTNPRPNVKVLLSVDEATYEQDPNTSHLPGGPAESGVMGDHPMSWCHDNLGGRAFYDWFREHLLGGIATAAKQVRARCKPPRERP
jgi:type 1 glutamine amidotransferase